MKRPFPLGYIDSDAPHNLELEVTLANPVSPEHIDLLAPIAAWIKVGQMGGMGGETIPPWKSGLSTLPPDFIDDHTVTFRFREVCIDPRSLMILENILQFIHVTGSPLDKAVITSNLLTTYRLFEDEFPPLYEPLPFTYDYGANDSRVWVEIEFEEDQPEEVLDEVITIAQAWGNLGAVCGYADPDAMPTAGYLVLDEINRYADMLTLSIQRKRATEFAFDALANMLQNIHARGHHLRVVRVL